MFFIDTKNVIKCFSEYNNIKKIANIFNELLKKY